jgi:hypothetical protein
MKITSGAFNEVPISPDSADKSGLLNKKTGTKTSAGSTVDRKMSDGWFDGQNRIIDKAERRSAKVGVRQCESGWAARRANEGRVPSIPRAEKSI